MSTRLQILVALLIAAITLLIVHYYCIAIVFFALFGLLLLEAAMCNLFLYSRLSLKIGRGNDASLIKVSWPFPCDILCIPLSLRLRWWEVKEIRAEIESSDFTIDACTYDLTGHESDWDTFTLDWRNGKTWIAIGYLSGGEMVIGNPVTHKFPGRKQNYPITLKVWHADYLIARSDYILDMNLRLRDAYSGTKK
jgi:hypothetical protein